MTAPAIRSLTRVFCEYDAQHQVYVLPEGVYGLFRVSLVEGQNRGKAQLQYRLSGANMKGPHSGRFPGRWVDWHERIRGTGEAVFASKSGQLRVWVTETTTDLLAEIADESIEKYLDQYRERVGRLYTPEAKFVTLFSRLSWCSLDPAAGYLITAKHPDSLNVKRLALTRNIPLDSGGNVILEDLQSTALAPEVLATVLALAGERNSLDRSHCIKYLAEAHGNFEAVFTSAKDLLEIDYTTSGARERLPGKDIAFTVSSSDSILHFDTDQLQRP